MNNYIHKIIDFFFHHEASDEITERVYNRMVFLWKIKQEKKLFHKFGINWTMLLALTKNREGFL